MLAHTFIAGSCHGYYDGISRVFRRQLVASSFLSNGLENTWLPLCSTNHSTSQNFLNLAVGHDARQPLPGPAAAADALRQRALALLEEWNDAHGDMYKGLRAAYRFLREGRRMKFPELQVGVVVVLHVFVLIFS